MLEVLLLVAGASFATLVGMRKEWLRRAGMIQFSRLRAPADQISADLYADRAVRLEAARHHGA